MLSASKEKVKCIRNYTLSHNSWFATFRSSHPEVFLGKCVMRICSKFTGEHPWFLCNVIEITLWHGCSPVNLLHIFRAPFSRNTSEWLLLKVAKKKFFFWFPEIFSSLSSSYVILSYPGFSLDFLRSGSWILIEYSTVW